MTKIHWRILERSYSNKLSVVNNFDGRCYECYDMTDAAWLLGVLNKLEDEE